MIKRYACLIVLFQTFSHLWWHFIISLLFLFRFRIQWNVLLGLLVLQWLETVYHFLDWMIFIWCCCHC